MEGAWFMKWTDCVLNFVSRWLGAGYGDFHGRILAGACKMASYLLSF